VRKSPEQVVEDGLSLVKATVQAMCVHPEMLRLDVEETAGSLGLTLTGHPSDTRRIVGKSGATLRALDNLTRLLFRGSDGLIKFYPVKYAKAAEDDRGPFKPDQDWPVRDITALAAKLAQAVFSERVSDVELREVSDFATRICVTVGGDGCPVLDRFASAMAQIFTVIGQVKGRVLYVVVRHAGEAANVRTI
jgi:predicted RNA-binding protein YlqC (UPF0109 family)